MKTKTKTTFMWSSPWINVSDMKQRIQQKEDIPVDQQRLTYNGRFLEDWHNLEHCIRTESIVYVREPLRGGMYHFTSGRQDFQLFIFWCC